jgi:hypothetical protein
MATLFIREDMAIITVHVNGIMYGETWKEAEGGNRVALGTTTLRRGVLQAVNLPNMGAGSDAGLLEIVIDCDQLAL